MTLFSGIRHFATKRRGWLIAACGLLLVAPALQACETHALSHEAEDVLVESELSSAQRAADEQHTETALCCVTDAGAREHGAAYAAVVNTDPRPSSPDDASPVAIDTLPETDASATHRFHFRGSPPHASALPVYLATRRLRL